MEDVSEAHQAGNSRVEHVVLGEVLRHLGREENSITLMTEKSQTQHIGFLSEKELLISDSSL